MSGAAVAGPYWVRTNTNGTHDVCGRHAKVVRSYRADQMAMADTDCRRLQVGLLSAERRLREAAPELLEALQMLQRQALQSPDLIATEWGQEALNATAAAISKATGHSSLQGVENDA